MYKFANRKFNSREEIHTELLNFVKNNPHGYIVENNIDNTWIYSLFEFHPFAGIKLLNMKYLMIKIHPIYNMKCFFVVYNDGTCDDISYIKCIYCN